MKKKKKEGRRHDNMTWMLRGAYKGARCAMASTLLKVSVIYEKWWYMCAMRGSHPGVRYSAPLITMIVKPLMLSEAR